MFIYLLCNSGHIHAENCLIEPKLKVGVYVRVTKLDTILIEIVSSFKISQIIMLRVNLEIT